MLMLHAMQDEDAHIHANDGPDALCSDDRDPADAWPALLPGGCSSSSCITKACPRGGAWDGLAQVGHHPPDHLLDHHGLVRLLLNLLAASIIPLLTWLLANSAAKPYRGVKR